MIQQYILFRVGTNQYGLDIRYVKGIEKYASVTPVPEAPQFIEGMINLRGEVIPIFGLRRKFGLPKIKPTEETKLIVTNCQGLQLAFEVDQVLEIFKQEEDAHTVPQLAKNDTTSYMENILHTGNGLAIILNVNHMFTQAEKESFMHTIEQMTEDMK